MHYTILVQIAYANRQLVTYFSDASFTQVEISWLQIVKQIWTS